jgi:hypothetical protein
MAADSGLRMLGVSGHNAPEWARALQLPLAAAVAMVAAVRGRWAAVPVVAIAVRVATDPYTFSYYGGGLVAAAFLWDTACGRRRPTATVAALVVGYLPIFLLPLGAHVAGWTRLIGCVALVLIVLRQAVRPAAAVAAVEDDDRELVAA